MNAIKCEMCNSNDFIKEDGYFVCQHCGTKYTVEEAKKMMIEGTVDVTGSTVKVDNTAFVQKYLANARRAKEKEDWEETEKYYNLVEQNDPTNIEAIFYSSYGKAKASLVDGNLYKRQAAFKVLQNCVSIIDDNFDPEKEEQERPIVEQISNDIISMSCSSYVFNQKKNGYGIVTWSDKNETITLFNGLGLEFCTTLENIIQKIDQKEKKLFYYEKALIHATWVMNNVSIANRKTWQDQIMKYHNLMHEIDPSHEVPAEAPAPAKKSGCYVATCVYGSYDCPEVWTLRRYRDDTLGATWYGRAFVHTYYAISPTLVKWFGDTKWFKKMWHGRLDNMVKKLNNNGVENTPYEDKEW